MRNPVQAIFFSWTSLLTTYFPRLGRRLLDVPIRFIVGNPLVSFFFKKKNQSSLKRVRTFRRFLVHPDIHIGDAVMAQAAVTALRDFFPDAEIDFVANKSVMPLIEGNPEISHFLALYSGGVFAPDSELKNVGELIKKGNYDLCININPFLSAGDLSKASGPVFDFTTHAATMVRNEGTATEVNHIAFQYHRFVHELLGQVAAPRRLTPLAGVGVRLVDSAFEEAAQFLEGFPADRTIVLMNTDTASPYTRLPFAYQVDLVIRLLKDGVSLLIGAGHVDVGIGNRLFEAIPTELRPRVRLIPAKMSLPAYAALSDQADLFISGDTGPMHIAAARKYSRTGKYKVRNQTAVLCFFGATPARMSGYASNQAGYFAANQEAPSWTFVAASPCRNITCLNKLFKTCKTVRCFEVLDLDQVMQSIMPQLRQSLDRRRLARE